MTLIAAHRGRSGGNIPCNTFLSYELSLKAGADVVELDISKSKDGELFCFHPGMEPVMFETSELIIDMNAADVKKRPLCNPDHTPTQFVPPLFDEVLEYLKGRCLIALDKFWMYMPEIAAAVRRHNMTEQVMCKIQDTEACYEEALCTAPDLPLLPIVHHKDQSTERLLQKNLRLYGMEVIFDNDTDPVASPEYIEFMHRNGLSLWVNSIIYNYRKQLSGGHSDDAAMQGDPDYGWGWLIDRKFDIIQTDWIPELFEYRNRKGR